jgi:ABC-type Fe3+ transport system permease subunit
MMNKLEKKICILAIIFIVLYLGAIFITLNSREERTFKTTRIESADLKPEERTFMVAELLLPMAIFSALTICFIIARKRRARKIKLLDDDLEDTDDVKE